LPDVLAPVGTEPVRSGRDDTSGGGGPPGSPLAAAEAPQPKPASQVRASHRRSLIAPLLSRAVAAQPRSTDSAARLHDHEQRGHEHEARARLATSIPPNTVVPSDARAAAPAPRATTSGTTPEDERERRHHDRPQPDLGGLARRVDEREALRVAAVWRTRRSRSSSSTRARSASRAPIWQ
jgi:hypothetical protein